MDYKFFLSFFAKPLGAIINKGLAAGAASVLGWSAAKGNPLGDVAPLVASVVLSLSTIISGFAATQGIQIPIINDDTTNGVKVVASSVDAPKVNSPLR